MNILLVELDPKDVLTDEILFINKQKEQFIYEHLRHYCSKFYPLPTISVRVYKNSVIVTHGHLYLAIAKELGHQRIRAIIDINSPYCFIQKLLNRPSVIKLDWNIVRQEDNELVSYCWLVFFFKRSLNQKEKKVFEEQVVRFFEQIPLPEFVDESNDKIQVLSYPNFGYCAEIKAYLPWEDERWYSTSRAVLLNFHFNCVPIVSFQGRKWQI